MSTNRRFAEIDEQKLRRAFLEEAEDLLEKLGQSLLALEQRAGDQALINEIFRLTHSLKSGSALIGFGNLSSLAHRLEDVFDAVRKSAISLTRPLMDAVFAASDLLHELVGRIAREGSDAGVDIAVTLGELQRLAGATASAPLASSIPPAALAEAEILRLDEFQRALVLEALDRGERVHRIEVQIDEGAEIMYPRAYLLFNTLESATNLIRSVPDMAAAPGDDLLYWRPVFLVSSALSAERLRELCSLDLIGSVEVESWDRRSLETAGVLDPEEVPAPAGGSPVIGPGAAGRPTVRVDTRKLNEIWQLVGELVTFKAHLARVHEGVRRASVLEPGLTGEIERASDTLERITGEMQQAIMQTRMVPIAVLFKKFPRLVRDLTRKLGKSAELEIAGEATEIDRTIVEALSDPLTHVVRNSLDHGLEPPGERQVQNKPATGRIRISAQQQGGKIVVEVEDDGRGLDLERIRRKAGLPAGASEAEIMQVVFRPGFSTKDDVTDLSGRGVGMDVVATRIREDLKGEVELVSQKDRGTLVRFLLPLTLTILHSLIVRCGRYLCAIPIRDIEETVKVSPGERRTGVQGISYAYRGRDIPLLPLPGLLRNAKEGGEDKEEQADAAGVVVRQKQRLVCLTVDELVEEQDVVIKPVSELLNPRRLFSGTSVLGDGTVLFILDTGRIAELGFDGG